MWAGLMEQTHCSLYVQQPVSAQDLVLPSSVALSESLAPLRPALLPFLPVSLSGEAELEEPGPEDMTNTTLWKKPSGSPASVPLLEVPLQC